MIPLMNNLTTLCLFNLSYQCDNNMLTSFSNLIHSPKLKCVTIGNEDRSMPIPKPFCDILFGPSSLNELSLLSLKCEGSCLDSLETANITKLSLSNCSISTPLFQNLSKILLNKTIQKLQINVTSESETLDLEQVDTFKAALSSNTSLEHLKISMFTENCTHDWSFITSDPRVTIE